MKKILLALGLLLMSANVKASTVGELFDTIVTNPHFTILESVRPIYFYDAIEKQHQGGAASDFYQIGNGWLTATAGWVDSIEDTTQKGGAILGGTVHAGALFKIFFPDAMQKTKEFLPESSWKFVDSLDAGFAFKHNFQREAFTCGFFSGINLKF